MERVRSGAERKQTKRCREAVRMEKKVQIKGPSGAEVDRLREENATLKKRFESLRKDHEACQARERLLRQVTDNMFDMVCLVDVAGNLQYVSPSHREALGYDPGAVLGQSILSGVHPEDHERVSEAFRQGVATRVHTQIEFRFLHADGHYIWVDSRGNNFYDAAGQMTGVVLVSRDITERKRTEEALALREDELKQKSRHLEELNTALNVLLRHRDEDRAELEKQIVAHMRELVLPYLERLKGTPLDEFQQAYLDVLDRNLTTVLSPFLKRLSAHLSKLTPKELFCANLIREGKKTSEIARMMQITPGAVELHRNHIRTKLGIKGVKANLQSYLLSLS